MTYSDKHTIDRQEFKEIFSDTFIAQVKNKNPNALRFVYEKYLSDFICVVNKVYFKTRHDTRHIEFSFQDYLSQIYLDLPYYDYSSPSFMIQSALTLLPYICYGGYDYIKSMNPKKQTRAYTEAQVYSFDMKMPSKNGESERTFYDYFDSLGIDKNFEDEIIEKIEGCYYTKNKIEILKKFMSSILPPTLYSTFLYRCKGYSAQVIKEKTGHIFDYTYFYKKVFSNYNKLKTILIDLNLFKPEYDLIAAEMQVKYKLNKVAI